MICPTTASEATTHGNIEMCILLLLLLLLLFYLFKKINTLIIFIFILFLFFNSLGSKDPEG